MRILFAAKVQICVQEYFIGIFVHNVMLPHKDVWVKPQGDQVNS